MMSEVQDTDSIEINNKEVVRAVLEGDAKAAYDKMVEVLKAENDHIKFTPSKLVCGIVKRYFASYFEQDKAQLANEFFDPKEHLKVALKSAKTPEELEKALTEALDRVKNGQGEIKPIRKKRGPKPKGEIDLISEKTDEIS
jgi:hypothetical protein